MKKYVAWTLAAVAVLAASLPTHAARKGGGKAATDEDAGGDGPPAALVRNEDWSVPVPGWKALQPGEHPRLIFRKDDLPALRQRAATPAGKVIVERLKKQLETPAFTTWHASGYALLYQVTGDKAYADKAREFAEKTLAGQGNPDNRYTWPGNGQLRAGPCMAGLALAYDLAYDGWDEETRTKVAKGIMANRYFEEIPHHPRHVPGCNHWGAHTGGSGIALLALKGDPGVDSAKIDPLLEKVTNNARREIAEGYGPQGYYYEGHHCGRLSSNSGLVSFVQAYRVAAGRDLVAKNEHAQWLVTKWVYEFVDHPAGAKTGPYTYNSRGMYCGDFGRSGISSGGDFAQGFGICSKEHLPAVLWLYNHIIEPGEKTYDVDSYPHRAAYALMNWPLDVQERNPGELFPLARFEEGPGYCVFRNGWKDKGNIVVTALLGSSPRSGRGMGVGGSIMVAGHGIRYTFPGMFHSSKATYKHLSKDGSGVVSAVGLDNPGHGKSGPAVALPKKPSSLAVDFSGASGAPLLVAQTGPQIGHRVEYWLDIKKMNLPRDIKDVQGSDGYATKTVYLTTGMKQPWVVMTLQKGAAPAVKGEGDKVTVGGQTLTFDGEKITLSK